MAASPASVVHSGPGPIAPSPRGSANRMARPRFFLSLPIAASRRSAATGSPIRVGRPSRSSSATRRAPASGVARPRPVASAASATSPRSDGLAVRQPIFRRLFQRVRHRVARVEDRPPPSLALVLAHHRRLDLDAPPDQLLEGSGIPGDQRVRLPLQPLEVRPVGDQAVLHRLRQSGAELPIGQRRERERIGHHRDRRVEGADQVLPLGRVHAGLAADRRVEHGEQRGGHLHVGHAAHVGGGDEAGQVAGDSPAQCHDRRCRARSRAGAARR